MPTPYAITDGKTVIEFTNNSIPVFLGNVTLTGNGEIPVSVDLDGATVNAVFPDTVNSAITNNITVNDVIETVNVSVVNNHDITPAMDSGVYDAFGRTRVCEVETIFQSTVINDNGSLYWNELETGTANQSSSVWTQNTASVALTVNASQNVTRVRQTYQRFNYQAGKSQEVMISFVPGSTINGVRKEVGYGDANDGLFFQTVNTGVGFCQRSTANGTKVDTFVAQEDWNIDTLNGAGPSGITLEVTKTQILFIDFEWLGVGRTRLGFVIDGQIIYCHAFNNANNLSTVYMRSPNLPLRYSISGNGSQAAPSTLTAICASVGTEGGLQLVGTPRAASSGLTEIALPNSGNLTLIKAIRLSANGINTSVLLESFDVLNTDANASAEIQLVLDPTLSASPSWSAVSNSQVEQATGNATIAVTGGTLLHAGYIASRSSATLSATSKRTLGLSINGTSQVLALCASRLAGNPKVYGEIGWTEL